MANLLEPTHPSEILREEFMRPMKISQNKLARDIDVPVARINDIVNCWRAITVDTTLRLAVHRYDSRILDRFTVAL